MAKQNYYVGIDLGTTFSSLVYVDDDGRVEALRMPDGSFQVASVIYFKSLTDVVIGNEALNFALLHSDRVARAFKRHMGDPNFHFSVDGKSFRPEELSAMIVKKLLETAVAQLGPIEHAVISVPFVFDELRRRATQAAGKIAGLRSIELIDEPVAAALAYGHTLMQSGGFHKVEDVYTDETVLVYDLGGGTFDATVMSLGRDGTFEVKATDGDERLGGEDWDNCLLDMICEEYSKRASVSPKKEPEFMQELRIAAVNAKKTLSERPRAEVVTNHNGKKIVFHVARGDFEKKTEPLLARTEHTLRDMLERHGMDWNHVDRILMVGGSSRMPMVRKMLERVARRTLDMSLPPDTAIAKGAGLYAAYRSGKQSNVVKEVRTVNSHALGLMVRGTRTGKVENDVLLKANEPTLKRVRREYRVPKGHKEIELRILLGDAKDPEACMLLGQGCVKGLPPDIKPEDKLEVSFYFLESGLLQVEAVVRRADGKPGMAVQFDVVVEGKMSETEVDASSATLRGISIE